MDDPHTNSVSFRATSSKLRHSLARIKKIVFKVSWKVTWTTQQTACLFVPSSIPKVVQHPAVAILAKRESQHLRKTEAANTASET